MAAMFTIVNVAPRTRAMPGGLFTKVQEITFVTEPSKVTGTVDVPDDQATPENVATIVTEQAARLEAIKNL